jgi:hypothetical protein
MPIPVAMSSKAHICGRSKAEIVGSNLYSLIAKYVKARNQFSLELEYVGRDNSVGTATRYRLDSPGIESRWR